MPKNIAKLSFSYCNFTQKLTLNTLTTSFTEILTV